MRRTQASEYYLCLKYGQTSAVYSVMSDRASSPTAETAKKCKMTPTNVDGGRLEIFLTLYAIVQYMQTYFNWRIEHESGCCNICAQTAEWLSSAKANLTVTALSSCAHRPVLEQSSSCSIKAEAKKLEQATKMQNGSKGIDVEEWLTPDLGRFTPGEEYRYPFYVSCSTITLIWLAPLTQVCQFSSVWLHNPRHREACNGCRLRKAGLQQLTCPLLRSTLLKSL